MAIDTAASITTFDFNPLHMANYPTGNIIETTMVETANGMMEVDIIQTNVLSAFGHSVRGMKVQMYDFLKRGVISDYDGVLGLDFFENTEFTVNMKNQTIEVKPAWKPTYKIPLFVKKKFACLKNKHYLCSVFLIKNI